MRSFLVIGEDDKTWRVIREALGKDGRVDRAPGSNAALEVLQKKRYDLLFIDIELLERMSSGNKFRTALKKFWNLYPTIEIIVMAMQETTRKAVMAVKEGASNYLTYPLVADEVRHAVEITQDYVIMQTELEYLRDQFWHPGALKIVQTKSPTSMTRPAKSQ